MREVLPQEEATRAATCSEAPGVLDSAWALRRQSEWGQASAQELVLQPARGEDPGSEKEKDLETERMLREYPRGNLMLLNRLRY